MAIDRLSSAKVWDPARVNHPGHEALQPFVQATASPPGRLVFVSGQVGLNRDGDLVGPGDMRAQAEQALANLVAVLAEAGATVDDVAKLTVYVTDMARFPEVQEVRRRYWDGRPLPASTAVEVRSLVRPEMLVEIEAYAVVPLDR